MWLVAGLGNPGSEYVVTRHNIGFQFADTTAERWNASPWREKFRSKVADLTLPSVDGKVWLQQPLTFMNQSGDALSQAARYHRLSTGRILVVHDDIDLAPGIVRVKRGGGAGGHNGLKSIDEHLGEDYWRLRVGIGRPARRNDSQDEERVTQHVLSNFSKAEQQFFDQLLDLLADHLPALLHGLQQDDAGPFLNGISLAMRQLTARTAASTASA